MMNGNLVLQAQLADLRAICEQAGARFSGSGHSTCPLHNGSNPQQFHLYKGEDGRARWKCFGDCNDSGDVIAFVEKWRNMDFLHAVEWITSSQAADPRELAERAAQRTLRAAQDAEEAARRARQAVKELQEAQAWLRFHEALTTETRKLWNDAGVPDWYTDYMKFGYARYFSVETKRGRWITSALSMPHYMDGWQVENVAMRLLTPPTPRDKYRPLKSGISIPPFIADPDKMYLAENFLVVEGQKKAAVSWVTLDSDKWQAVGIQKGTAGAPGKKELPPSGAALVERLKGRSGIVCLDPDATPEAVKLARTLGFRVLVLPGKIDDMIIEGGYSKTTAQELLRQARRV